MPDPPLHRYFQGFNWESWIRKWYLEIAPKAADLSKCGITAVWLPPPTEYVAPQGYMPSDLYNLNSAYGSEEELQHCIEEMHNQDLLICCNLCTPSGKGKYCL
ncbi:alpha-amylase AMY3-like isoform X2 [Actinidia eriantha]|uniref:alpha-amylase AMY3-like isoform X2 n=1 Tax=Actinidia eriantha TaxID=165200 RepID=UPI002589D3F4|nr:alpha-amylase AMY3-like isoform X2 [Actinidia eriantha]